MTNAQTFVIATAASMTIVFLPAIYMVICIKSEQIIKELKKGK